MFSIRKVHSFLFSSALLFGFMAVMKELLPSASVTIGGRFLVSSLFLLIWVVGRALYTKQSIRNELRLNATRDKILVVFAGIFLALHGFAFFYSIEQLSLQGAGLTLIWAYSFFNITTSVLDASKWIYANKIKKNRNESQIIFSKEILIKIGLSSGAIILIFFGLFLSSPLAIGEGFSIETINGVLLAAASGVFYGIRAFFVTWMSENKAYEGKEKKILLPEQFVAVVTAVILILISTAFPETEFQNIFQFDIDVINMTVILRVFFLGIASTAMAHHLFYKGAGAAESSSSTVSVISTSEVIVGMAYLQIFNIREAELIQYAAAIIIIIAIMVKSGFINEQIESIKEAFRMTRKNIAFQTGDWKTPQEFFDVLNKEFNFTLDPCATDECRKCDNYYTLEKNGLLQDWSGHTVFMNPPYGPETARWVEKAYEESKKGTTVVCIIADSTEATYWHDIIIPKAKEIRFIRGKLEFEGVSEDAPAVHAVVVFGKKEA